MAFGKYAVDYEQRIDYPRLRRERVEKVKAQMAKDGIGALWHFVVLIRPDHALAAPH